MVDGRNAFYITSKVFSLLTLLQMSPIFFLLPPTTQQARFLTILLNLIAEAGMFLVNLFSFYFVSVSAKLVTFHN